MTLKLSLAALAMAAAVLTAAPVYALSLNVGGDSLLSTGHSESTPAVHVGIGDGSGGNASVLGVDVGNNGSDNSTHIRATVGGGSDGHGLLGGDDLLGTGNILGGNGGLLPATVDIGIGLDLFGDGTNGGNGGPGGNGGNGGSGGGGNGFLFASLFGSAGATGNAARCITPNGNQLATLTNRHQYSHAMINGAGGVRIIKVPVCASVRARVARSLAGNGNVQQLQTILASRSAVRGELDASGYGLGNVVAADSQGGQLILNVM